MEQKDMSMENKTLDNLFLSVAQSLMGEPPFFIWPAPHSTPAECEFYLGNNFLDSLYTDIAQLQQKGHDLEGIAKMLKNPSRIAQTLWPFGHVVNVDEKFKKELIELASTIVDLLSYYRKNPFNQDGKNTIWSQNEVHEFLSNNQIIDTADESFEKYKLLISRLEGTLWLYSELLDFSIHEVCKEFHGPYSLPDGRIALVKEYYDLQPEFWAFTKDMPYQSILIFEIYSTIPDITFDFFGRLRSKQPTIHNLEGFTILANQKPTLTYNDIKEIYESTTEVSRRGSEQVRNLSRLQIMNKFVECYYYMLKPLKDTLGKNWEPPEIIFDDIKNERKKEIIEQLYANFEKMAKIPPNETINIVSKIFDPRYR